MPGDHLARYRSKENRFVGERILLDGHGSPLTLHGRVSQEKPTFPSFMLYASDIGPCGGSSPGLPASVVGKGSITWGEGFSHLLPEPSERPGGHFMLALRVLVHGRGV